MDPNVNPWSDEGWSLTAQTEYVKTYGMARARARAADAGTTVGGKRPVKLVSAKERLIILNKFSNTNNGSGGSGTPGTNGTDGWSPILAVVTDGARRVLQVTDWTGGTGTKPTTGDYLGATGLTSVLADAVDIRGAAGTPGVDGSNGQGVPLGGTTNQILRKIDATDFNTEWHSLVAADVGLGNVDNTSDATKNAAVATLTNKTLTAPVITSPTGIVKGDVGLGNVDNTSDATKNAAAVTLTNKTIDGGTNTVQNLPLGSLASGIVDTDSLLAANSDLKLATQKAVKTYVDSFINSLAGDLIFKGAFDASAGSFPGGGTAKSGYFYRVSVAGTVNGEPFDVGDSIYAIVNNASTTTYAANWLKVNGDITSAEVIAALGFTPFNAANVDTDGTLAANSDSRVASQKATKTYADAVAPRISFDQGRLTFVSATALKFAPYKGDMLRINGKYYRIPAAGITGLANTGVFVNGTGSSNLAASTLYFVYAFDNGGTVTADFRTGAHATSSTSGNQGQEILSGDDTRSLIGMAWTNASSQFSDAIGSRNVASWFNRRPRAIQALTAGSITTISTTFVTATGTQGDFVTWGDAAVQLVIGGFASNNTASSVARAQPSLDGTTVGALTTILLTNANDRTGIGSVANSEPSEGHHTAEIQIDVSAGTGTFTLGLTTNAHI